MSFRTILPAETPDPPGRSGGILTHATSRIELKKRPTAKNACEACQKKKVRCFREGLTCRRCMENEEKCVFRSSATGNHQWKEKHDVLVHKAAKQASEIQHLRELIQLMDHRSGLGASDNIISRLEDPNGLRSFIHELRQQDKPHSGILSSKDIDENALKTSGVRLPAHPWTSVAGNGIVSHLIFSFFKHDQIFLFPGIDPDCFIEDMGTQNPRTSKYCSPLLVNAICALRALTNPFAKEYGERENVDLSFKFLEEAKLHAERDSHKTSIPNIQGLYLLFSVYGTRGSDRHGQRYRDLACGQFLRYSPERKLARATFRDHRAISRALWGLFCTESINAWAFRHESMLQPPAHDLQIDNEAKVGSPPRSYSATSPSHYNALWPPDVPGVFKAQSDFCHLLNKVIAWNRDKAHPPGSREDMDQRAKYWATRTRIKSAFPMPLLHQLSTLHDTPNRHAPHRVYFQISDQALFLSSLIDMVDIKILGDLSLTDAFPPTTDNELSRLTEPRPVKEYLLDACRSTAVAMQMYINLHPPGQDLSCFPLAGLFTATMEMTRFLDNPSVVDDFIDSCNILKRMSSRFGAANNVLLALAGTVSASKKPISDKIKKCFEGLGTKSASPDGQAEEPPATNVAVPDSVRRELGGGDDDDDDDDGHLGLGALINRVDAIALS